MRSLRPAAVAAVCLSAAALLTACDPEGGDGGGASTAAAPPPATSAAAPSPSASPSGNASASAGAGAKISWLPAAAWAQPQSLPLNATAHWAPAAQSAKDVGAKGQFAFEQVCHVQRDGAAPELGRFATASFGGSGEWKADQAIAHYGVHTSGPTQNAFALLGGLKSGVKACATGTPGAKVEVKAEDSEYLVAVLTVPQPDGGSVELHEYLSTSAGSLTELAVQTRLAKGAHPKTAWTAPADSAVLASIAKPVCTAYQDC